MQAGFEEGAENMDKKSNSRQSAPPKSGGADAKKDNGGNSGRQFPQYTKRREGPIRPRSDGGACKKPAPQKSRTTFDKRPRARGYYNERQKNEVTYPEDVAEYGSAQRPGSKKGYINSLINFSYGEPRSYRSNRGSGGLTWSSRNRWNRGRAVLKYNKEQFLQANCQFVVRAGADYSVYVADPDKLVDWDLIEQVRIFSPEVPSCPICLYPPTAAKITRCGHIYCWSCILHYLSLDDKTWRKCPICYESIHSKDLRSVVSMETHSYTAGEQITMRLMKRLRGSSVAMPIGQWSDRGGHLYSVNDTDCDTSYVKMLEADPAFVQAIIDTERNDLETQLKVEGAETLEGSYIKSALENVKERQRLLNERKNVDDMFESMHIETAGGALVEVQPTPPKTPTKKLTAKKEDVIVYSDAFLDEVAQVTIHETTPGDEQSTDSSPIATADEAMEDSVDVTKETTPVAEDDEGEQRCDSPMVLECAVTTVDAEELELPSDSPPVPHPHTGGLQAPKDVHYFYQATGGLHIYMQSLNARCLVQQYGSLANCPETITATIVELESGSITPDLRSRLRYLNHLPLTCEFKVAELALKPPVISKATIHMFAGEIEKRRKRRQKKARDDKRVAKRMQEDEDRKHGKYGELGVNLESHTHFPIYSSSINFANKAEILLATSPGAHSHPSTVSSNSSTPFGSPPSTGLNPDAIAFVPVSMKNVPSAPELTTMETSSQSASGSMSFAQMLKAGKSKPAPAWPKASDAGVSTGSRPRRGSDSEPSDCEDRVPVPTYQDSFGDAIQQALQTYQKDKGEEGDAQEAGGKKNKKKKPKKLLFTTTMARNK